MYILTQYSYVDQHVYFINFLIGKDHYMRRESCNIVNFFHVGDGGLKKLFQKKKITWPPCRNIYHHYKNHATRFLLLKKPANRESLGIDTDLETALPAFFSASAARLSAKITAGVVFSLSDEVGVG